MSICVCECICKRTNNISIIGHTADSPLLPPSSWCCSPRASGCFSPLGIRLTTALWMAALVLGSPEEEGASAGTGEVGEVEEDMRAVEGVVS